MLEAASAPAARSYEQIQQSLQILLEEYRHSDSSCAHELAGKLRTIAQQLEGQREAPSSQGAPPCTEAALDSHNALASLERSWASSPPENAATGECYRRKTDSLYDGTHTVQPHITWGCDVQTPGMRSEQRRRIEVGTLYHPHATIRILSRSKSVKGNITGQDYKAAQCRGQGVCYECLSEAVCGSGDLLPRRSLPRLCLTG